MKKRLVRSFIPGGAAIGAGLVLTTPAEDSLHSLLEAYPGFRFVDREADEGQFDREGRARESLIRTCMMAQGWEYTPVASIRVEANQP